MVETLGKLWLKPKKYSLSERSSSRYGNRGFIFSSQDLMNGYKLLEMMAKSRMCTLRKQALYDTNARSAVIIVVMTEDLENKNIRELPSIFYEPCYDHNGCIEEDEKFINDRSPSFKLKHPIESYSWESMAFAFYFPSSNDLLRLKKELGREVEVDHTFCTSTRQRRHPPYDWVCPNEMSFKISLDSDTP